MQLVLAEAARRKAKASAAPPRKTSLLQCSSVPCKPLPWALTKNYLDVIDPVDEEAGHEADAAGGRRDRDFLVQRSRFLAALKTRLGLILAKAVAMRVMINATGCPAPVLDVTACTHTRTFPN